MLVAVVVVQNIASHVVVPVDRVEADLVYYNRSSAPPTCPGSRRQVQKILLSSSSTWQQR